MFKKSNTMKIDENKDLQKKSLFVKHQRSINMEEYDDEDGINDN